MTKNPFMSAYLSAANRVANTAHGHATNEFKRQSTSMVNAWVDAWTPKPKAKAKPARKRKSS
jgi:calcineurin-like phosphoesterase family protein